MVKLYYACSNVTSAYSNRMDTGHENYAKTFQLYVQLAMSLECDFLHLCQQFTEESCTVRRIEFGILWILDRLFYQTNFKELFKIMTKNVMNVWVKTVHSTAELCDAMKQDNIR